MSEMSPVLTAKARREKLRDSLAMNTYDEIAQLCGVTKRTIRRDVEQWKQEGGYDEWLTEQFFKLYGLVKTQDIKHAFDRICDLMRRRQAQITVTRIEGGQQPIVIKMWKPEDEQTS